MTTTRVEVLEAIVLAMECTGTVAMVIIMLGLPIISDLRAMASIVIITWTTMSETFYSGGSSCTVPTITTVTVTGRGTASEEPMGIIHTCITIVAAIIAHHVRDLQKSAGGSTRTNN
ncbi:hypothetical protein SAY87_003670 [Trapa incisa]|uniref:Uncharacterized protein n=1 Tax=Trapa incisa TaxID=236973 RepID=A0AAN7QI93_9MYRT|nr:hypothetical protein SAY87_003670 [Trapa incisa]